MADQAQIRGSRDWIIPIAMVAFVVVALIASPLWAFVAALLSLTNILRYARLIRLDRSLLGELIPLVAINIFVAGALAVWAFAWLLA